MSISFRLTVMNFMQFFVWNASAHLLRRLRRAKSLGFTGIQIGSIYGSMGVASLFMPGIMGIIADRWINAERLYGILHLTGAGLLVWASTVRDYDTLYFIMLLNAMVFMPTIALNNAHLFPRARTAGPELHQPVSTDPRLGHGRLRHCDGLRIFPVALIGDRAAFHQCHRRGVPRALRVHDAGLRARTVMRPEDRGPRLGTGCLRTVQESPDGRVFPLRDDAGRRPADHERVRRRFPGGLQQVVSRLASA